MNLPHYLQHQIVTFSFNILLRLITGIRAGSGNVMLYGPAGTGKTIMCQAAAFEARAELIIGKSDGHCYRYNVSIDNEASPLL